MTGAKHTPGPWRFIIDDTGGQWSGWPLCIEAESDEDKVVVRTGGQWPYEWDAATSQREAVANARLIASAPCLLEAAARAEDVIDDFLGHLSHEEQAQDPTVGQVLVALRAAIAKATGAAS